MKLLCLALAALLLTAVVIEASPTNINIGGGGAQGGGHGGGHGGPNWNPEGWQRAFSRVIAPAPVSDSRFVQRRLLVKVVPRTMQETTDTDEAEWREGLAGIKKDLRRTVVGTPLPANRFDKSAGV